MADVNIRTLDGRDTAVSVEQIQALAASLRGEVITPASATYDEARSIWNAMIDRKPGMIIRCVGVADVIRAVRFARDANALIAVRGAGHNIAGNALCDDGIVIDLSQMRSVRVDPVRRVAQVEPGCTLADLDCETQAFGLATPVGINSTTGIAGLTLGGGFGWLSRSLGLTIDNLLSVDMVTADGSFVRASETENPDLFWAVRGGGGNFGIVTSFEFQLHEVGTEFLAGLIVHPFEDAPELLRFYREFAAGAPDELSVWVVMRKAPPLPFLPAEWHGREVVVLAALYAGADMKQGEKSLESLRKWGKPIADVIGPTPYTGWQQAFDPLLTPGARNYWKSHDFMELSDGLLDTLVDFSGRLPGPECEIFIAQMGGETKRTDAEATAYAERNAEFIMNVHTRWREPAQDDECVSWARALFDAAAPHATGGVYVNFMPDDEAGRVQAAYGANYERLALVKAKYDPDNVFRLNQNIRPAATA